MKVTLVRPLNGEEVEFEGDPNTYTRYHSHFWYKVFSDSEYPVLASDELEKAYKEYKNAANP